MIELKRVILGPTRVYNFNATNDVRLATQLGMLIESTKRKDAYFEWDELISVSFRYPPPHPLARFRPLYGNNVFYGSLVSETALYEFAYYIMKERINIKKVKSESGVRLLFTVDANNTQSVNVRFHQNCSSLIDRYDYSASHQFVKTNPQATFIIYPSCRDPRQRDNAAVLDINHLDKYVNRVKSLRFFYDYEQKVLLWMDYKLQIAWSEVS